jgi:AraC-like DNA-binding protein
MNQLAHRGAKEEIPSTVVDLIFQAAAQIGLNLEPTLKELGRPVLQQNCFTGSLSPEEFAPIYLKTITALSAYVHEQDGRIPPTDDDIELAYHCVINSKNLHEAIIKTIRFNGLLNGRGGEMCLEVRNQEATFLMKTFRNRRNAPALILDGFGLSCFYRLFSWLIGERLDILRVSISHKEFGHRNQFADLFDCPIQFDCAENAIVFSRKMLRRPIIRTFQELVEINHVLPFELMPIPAARLLSTYVQSIFQKALSEEVTLPTIEQIADHLGKSVPTLRRYLAAENTSYQALLDICRAERAVDLLQNTEQSIDDIAKILGFSGPSAFSRAFKSWKGGPPSLYRQTGCFIAE